MTERAHTTKVRPDRAIWTTARIKRDVHKIISDHSAASGRDREAILDDVIRTGLRVRRLIPHNSTPPQTTA